MAPTKLEKHIKDKLKDREVKPSAGAWDKISESLEEEPKQKSKRIVWYAVAASFIGLIIVSMLFFSSNTSELNMDEQIVTVPEEVMIPDSKDENEILKIEIESVVVETGTERIKQEKESFVKPRKYSAQNQNIVKEEIKIKESSQLADVSNKEKELLIDAKIHQVIEQVQLLERTSNDVTNAEVDSLLRKAQRELLTNKIFMENQKVDAIALLNEVENELDQTFRDQIFETLKSGFVKVRTAVADRNN